MSVTAVTLCCRTLTSGLNLLQITLESEEGSRRGRGSANIKLRADVNKKGLRGHFDLHLCLFRTSLREIHHRTAGNASLLWSIFSFAISTVSSIRNKFYIVTTKGCRVGLLLVKTFGLPYTRLLISAHSIYFEAGGIKSYDIKASSSKSLYELFFSRHGLLKVTEAR